MPHFGGGAPLSESEERAKMLIATDYARKMSLDLRMIDENGLLRPYRQQGKSLCQDAQ